jgi:NADH:ubiquinone oxidoreductase subunit 4 (subunit M)
VFFGSWKAFPLVTTLAVWGALIIGAVYMTRAIRNILHGPVPEKFSNLADASNIWRKLPYALLLASLLLFGFLPKLLTEKINPDAQKIVGMATNKGSTAASAVVVSAPLTTSVLADGASASAPGAGALPEEKFVNRN